jgi:tetratricopeptide (TPR) repeat protein
MATISEALNLALRHHQDGRLEEAERIYREVLRADPNQADAIHLLGMIAYQLGRYELAATLINRAIALNGEAEAFHYNLAKVYDSLRRTPEAIASCRRALELKPDFALAHNNLGLALKEQGNLEEAIACYRRALELEPNLAEAHNNLGDALGAQGKLEGAVACFSRARISPERTTISAMLCGIKGSRKRRWLATGERWRSTRCLARRTTA